VNTIKKKDHPKHLKPIQIPKAIFRKKKLSQTWSRKKKTTGTLPPLDERSSGGHSHRNTCLHSKEGVATRKTPESLRADGMSQEEKGKPEINQ